MSARVSPETEPTPMGDDPIEQVRVAFAELCEGLDENATVTRAKFAVSQALDTISANAQLIAQHERGRQEQVRAERARRAEAERIQAEQDAAAKRDRVAARRAKQTRSSKK